MYSDPNSVKRISSLGAGPIGGGWTAHFLARGYDVTAYLHDKSETNSFMSILKTAWISLSELGLAPSASMDRLRIVTDLEEALEGADFVQESGPERLEVKQELYSEIAKFNNKDFLVGGFQRDTEGSDLISPKLVKGPDIFIKLIKDLHKKNKNVENFLLSFKSKTII